MLTNALEPPQPAIPELTACLREADEYELLGWCLRGAGIHEPPMASLRRGHPALWDACVKAFRNT